MESNSNTIPTLLIGLGGFGARAVDAIYAGMVENENVKAFCIDSDAGDTRRIRNVPEQNSVLIGLRQSIADIVSFAPDCRSWFPMNSVLIGKTLSNGAGQVRSVARLAYETASSNGFFDRLLNEAEQLASCSIQRGCEMRVSVVTSLCGGTGSGIFIQIALLIRKHLKTRFPGLKLWIHGEFALPPLFPFVTSDAEMKQMKANTYAALKELNAINEHFYNNAPAVKLKFESVSTDTDDYVHLLPYDYCFIFGLQSMGGNEFQDVAKAVSERLFGSASSEIHTAFRTLLRTSAKKNSDSTYGVIGVRKFLSEKELIDHYRSDRARSAMTHRGQVLAVSSPGAVDPELLGPARNRIVVTGLMGSSSEIAVTEIDLGVKLYELDEFRPGSGAYYKAYHAVLQHLPQCITPHLDKNWHKALHDIGADPEETVRGGQQTAVGSHAESVPEESFVFVSYSSKESKAANQLKQVLEANGIKCWMAPQSIPAGSDYAYEIPKAISSCKALVLMLSKASQESKWVPKEVGSAIGKGKIIFPFQIDDADIDDAFNFLLLNSQRISAYNRLSEAYRELINRLKALL